MKIKFLTLLAYPYDVFICYKVYHEQISSQCLSISAQELQYVAGTMSETQIQTDRVSYVRHLRIKSRSLVGCDGEMRCSRGEAWCSFQSIF